MILSGAAGAAHGRVAATCRRTVPFARRHVDPVAAGAAARPGTSGANALDAPVALQRSATSGPSEFRSQLPTVRRSTGGAVSHLVEALRSQAKVLDLSHGGSGARGAVINRNWSALSATPHRAFTSLTPQPSSSSSSYLGLKQTRNGTSGDDFVRQSSIIDDLHSGRLSQPSFANGSAANGTTTTTSTVNLTKVADSQVNGGHTSVAPANGVLNGTANGLHINGTTAHHAAKKEIASDAAYEEPDVEHLVAGTAAQAQQGSKATAPAQQSAMVSMGAGVARAPVVQGKRMLKKALQKFADSGKRGLKKAKKLTVAFVRNPRVAIEWGKDLYEAGAHFCRWIITGGSLFKSNICTSFYLVKRVAKGYQLTVRQRKLLIRTSADCMKIIPFSFFVIVPFAELALPLVLRFFPNMMPSTFFEQKFDNPTLARKLKAKQEVAVFWQQVVAQRTQAILEADDHEHADKAAELQAFQEKLADGIDFPSVQEIVRFGRLFEQEMQLKAMSNDQLLAMSKILGLQPRVLPVHLQLQLRHHITHLQREDRDYFWEGVDSLKKDELIEACKKRAICFHGVTECQMRADLTRWLELSANRKIPLSLLLWIQSFYLSSRERVVSGQRGPDPRSFQAALPEKPPAPEREPEEGFHDLAERCKARLETAQTRLGDLSKEIDEAIDHPVEEEQPSGIQDEDANGAVALKEQVTELSKLRDLHRNIIDRQRRLIDHQLEFMSHMRDNMPQRNQDAGKVLLDQRVRLVEMVNALSRDTEDIEQLLGSADVAGSSLDAASNSQSQTASS